MSDDVVILMCAPVEGELLLPDNLVGRCAECGCKVQYRPHATGFSKLRCMPCAAVLTEEGDVMFTTPRMVEDFKRFLRRKKQ